MIETTAERKASGSDGWDPTDPIRCLETILDVQSRTLEMESVDRLGRKGVCLFLSWNEKEKELEKRKILEAKHTGRRIFFYLLRAISSVSTESIIDMDISSPLILVLPPPT